MGIIKKRLMRFMGNRCPEAIKLIHGGDLLSRAPLCGIFRNKSRQTLQTIKRDHCCIIRLIRQHPNWKRSSAMSDENKSLIQRLKHSARYEASNSTADPAQPNQSDATAPL